MKGSKKKQNRADREPDDGLHRQSSGQGHHGRKNGWLRFKHRIKSAFRGHRWLLPMAVLCLAIAIGGALLLWQSIRDQDDSQIYAQAQVNVGSGYRDVLYKGDVYHYNNRITTILFIGVDSEGPLTAQAKFTYAPRADSISLIVLDEYHRRMTIIALSRDTMTKIHRYTLNGRDRGLFKDHLGYAYTYGEGGEVSCRNVCTAVSELLYGIPINDYVVTNRSSMYSLAEMIGPLQVTVPNDDLAEMGWLAGDRITVDAENIETFVRARDISVELSNTGRMERQQAYVNASVARIREMLTDDSSGMWRRLETLENTLQTNITRSRYLDLVKALNNTGYDSANYYIPVGEQVVGERHDEFYPDQEELLKKIVEIFYIR